MHPQSVVLLRQDIRVLRKHEPAELEPDLHGIDSNYGNIFGAIMILGFLWTRSERTHSAAGLDFVATACASLLRPKK
jgi:uncharacterized membrane protein